ncbi:MAG: hypothetical protein KAT70_05155, partial [Thermoplasmata archaeon]|nr:hypothetical protein [Thermoplasmata archaeon]
EDLVECTGALTGEDGPMYYGAIRRGEAVLILLVEIDIGEDGMHGTEDDDEIEGDGCWITGTAYSSWWERFAPGGEVVPHVSYGIKDPVGMGSPLLGVGNATPRDVEYEDENGTDHNYRYLLMGEAGEVCYKIAHMTSLGSSIYANVSEQERAGYEVRGTNETGTATEDGGRVFNYTIDSGTMGEEQGYDGVHGYACEITDN